MKVQEVRYPYKPKLIVFILSIAFFVACAAVLGYVAATNDRGLILNGIIKFSENGATIFYWCLAGASVLLALFGVLGLVKGITSKREVLATQEAISAPKSGVSNKIITINYSGIIDLNVQVIQKQKFLNIFYSEGKLSIPQSMLPSKKAFEELADFVVSKVSG